MSLTDEESRMTPATPQQDNDALIPAFNPITEVEVEYPPYIPPVVSRLEFKKWRYESSRTVQQMSTIAIDSLHIPAWLLPSFTLFMVRDYPAFMSMYAMFPSSIFLEFLQKCEMILPLSFIEDLDGITQYDELYVPGTNHSRKWGM